MSHFKLTNTTKGHKGIILYQIELTKDCKWGKIGDKGGWIENESNLSGNAWVSDNAKVFGNAKVYDNAWVNDNAQVFGNARVCDNAEVYGDAWVSGAWIFGLARVYGDALVFGNARVFGNAMVSGYAKVYDNAIVSGNAMVFDSARVGGYAIVTGDAMVKDNAMVWGNARVRVSGDLITKLKYLLVTSTELQEQNIGILKYSGEVDNENLSQCLSQHFDLDVNVNSIEELSLHPLTFIAKCVRCIDEEIDMFNVELNETWLY